ncbi:MAG: hypothetical protein JXP73_00755 [Deltaproteobacteria bacterium]|nr:hypothetical protein [Deltaproteobacteria bacterium]
MDSVFVHRGSETAILGSGRLQGLRVALQPNLSVAGWPTDAGSRALADFKALEDATIVGRLRQAGACLCGSTRMSEFGFGLENSQAGEALRTKTADLELVLDLMGESRLAAARAGVCGLKPSYGLLSRLGLVGLVPSMECCGLLAADVARIRDTLQAIAGKDDLDFSLPDEEPSDLAPRAIEPRRTTLGLVGEAQGTLSAERDKAFRAAVGKLAAAGFAIKRLSMPDFPLFSLVHRIVGSVEASSCAGRYDSVRYGRRVPGARNWNEMYLTARGAAFGSHLKSYLLSGAFFQFERYQAFENACRIRARLLSEMRRLTAQVDALVSPAVGPVDLGAPPSLAETYAGFASTLFANVTGQPALVLPAADVAIQLVGARRGDGLLLALGERLLGIVKGGS